MIPPEWLRAAQHRIEKHIRATPLTCDSERNLYFKWENHQITGSFKARGAFNKVLSLEKWEQQAGLLAASAGNHGQGVALAGQLVGAPVRIYASENAPTVKINAMRKLGAEVVLVPGKYEDAEKAGLAAAAKSEATWISPYNDGLIIAGQGTLALETAAQLEKFPSYTPDQATWLVPASGGGLAAGVGAALAQMNPHPRLVAVQTDTSPFMHDLFHTGTQANTIELPTIADGLSGPVEPGSITIPLVQQLIDDFILVSEAETRQAIGFAWRTYGEKIEGAAAVSLAAVLSGKIPARPAVLIISGGNINDDLFQQILAETE